MRGKLYFSVLCIVVLVGCLFLLNACSPAAEEIELKEPRGVEENAAEEGPRHGGTVVFGDRGTACVNAMCVRAANSIGEFFIRV